MYAVLLTAPICHHLIVCPYLLFVNEDLNNLLKSKKSKSKARKTQKVIIARKAQKASLLSGMTLHPNLGDYYFTFPLTFLDVYFCVLL